MQTTNDKAMPKYIYKTEGGEGVTYSPTRGNYWGKIIVYTTTKLSEASKRIKTETIKEKSFVNGLGWIN